MKPNNCFIEKVTYWLKKNFGEFQIISDLFLIGSILDSNKNLINDVDVVQKLKSTEKNNLIELGKQVKEIKKDFLKEFSLPLHITTFTDNENIDFVIFMSKNEKIKVI